MSLARSRVPKIIFQDITQCRRHEIYFRGPICIRGSTILQYDQPAQSGVSACSLLVKPVKQSYSRQSRPARRADGWGNIWIYTLKIWLKLPLRKSIFKKRQLKIACILVNFQIVRLSSYIVSALHLQTLYSALFRCLRHC